MASDAAGPPPTTTAEIPELADFEHQKENIMPLKQGRKASVLSELYTSFHDDHARLQFLASQRKAFEDELANIDDLDDPLDVFNKYIQWIQQHYPEGQNAESDLLHVIERAITVFKKDSRYKNDPRYLKLWIMYARHSTEPIQIFKFLSVNEIGQELGIYYEEYAALMEKLGKCVKSFFHMITSKHCTILLTLNLSRSLDFKKRKKFTNSVFIVVHNHLNVYLVNIVNSTFEWRIQWIWTLQDLKTTIPVRWIPRHSLDERHSHLPRQHLDLDNNHLRQLLLHRRRLVLKSSSPSFVMTILVREAPRYPLAPQPIAGKTLGQ